MKTNQIMTRPMGSFKVEQRTKDGMFNATNLLDQWNKMVEENVGNPIFKKKAIADFFRLSQTKEFVEALVEEENLPNEKTAYSIVRGKKGGTWMHPILFVKFAMWLNPRFEVKVIKFVHDQMIAFRKESGDAYRELGQAVTTIVKKDFMPVAMSKIGEAINYCVFGSHEKNLRNQHGEEARQRELWQFEKKLADLINEGFLTSFDGVMEYLRKMWRKKFTPQVLLND